MFSGRTSICYLSINAYFTCCNYCLLSGLISMKLAICKPSLLKKVFEVTGQKSSSLFLIIAVNCNIIIRAISCVQMCESYNGRETCLLQTFRLGLHQCLVTSCVHVYYAVKYDVCNGNLGMIAAKSQGNVM